tara:strand:- start:201 stop:869 length:669 start_codon:yes stop_codon:yes gene_type:complete
MFKYIAALLLMASPVQAKDPDVTYYTSEATGCMILKECNQDVNQIKNFADLYAHYNITEIDQYKEELTGIIDALKTLNVEMYLGPQRYFRVGERGIYQTEYNRIFLNVGYLSNLKKFISTLRHEVWHTAQDCMAGTLDNSFMAVILDDETIPPLYKAITQSKYGLLMSSAVPWEQEAVYAAAVENMSLNAIEACAAGPMWEVYSPTPLTKKYLVTEGFMPPE